MCVYVVVCNWWCNRLCSDFLLVLLMLVLGKCGMNLMWLGILNVVSL